MPHYIVSYDLNGYLPSHSAVDAHIEAIAPVSGRILETVWYLQYAGNAEQLRQAVDRVLGPEDRLAVVLIQRMAWRNLLVSDAGLTDVGELDELLVHTIREQRPELLPKRLRREDQT